MGIYMGDLILGAILQYMYMYMVSASFSCFLWSVKGQLHVHVLDTAISACRHTVSLTRKDPEQLWEQRYMYMYIYTVHVYVQVSDVE